MKLSSFSYLMKEGFKNVFKNKTMSFASTATVCACILLMIFSYCFETNIAYMLEQIEESIGIAVFLDDGVTADDIIRISDEINTIDYISKVEYISPDEALDELVADWGVDEGILEGFTGSNNPLSNSFEIEISDITQQKNVVAQIEAINGVKSVRHAQNETDVLINVERVFRYVGIAILLLWL
ncbi:MAG: permease-like cell division protein FtsX [Firmicutes bacterium]|nr:permease-like cell division protein FtsX [Bacillota bacterium]